MSWATKSPSERLGPVILARRQSQGVNTGAAEMPSVLPVSDVRAATVTGSPFPDSVQSSIKTNEILQATAVDSKTTSDHEVQTLSLNNEHGSRVNTQQAITEGDEAKALISPDVQGSRAIAQHATSGQSTSNIRDEIDVGAENEQQRKIAVQKQRSAEFVQNLRNRRKIDDHTRQCLEFIDMILAHEQNKMDASDLWLSGWRGIEAQMKVLNISVHDPHHTNEREQRYPERQKERKQYSAINNGSTRLAPSHSPSAKGQVVAPVSNLPLRTSEGYDAVIRSLGDRSLFIALPENLQGKRMRPTWQREVMHRLVDLPGAPVEIVAFEPLLTGWHVSLGPGVPQSNWTNKTINVKFGKNTATLRIAAYSATYTTEWRFDGISAAVPLDAVQSEIEKACGISLEDLYCISLRGTTWRTSSWMVRLKEPLDKDIVFKVKIHGRRAIGKSCRESPCAICESTNHCTWDCIGSQYLADSEASWSD